MWCRSERLPTHACRKSTEADRKQDIVWVLGEGAVSKLNTHLTCKPFTNDVKMSSCNRSYRDGPCSPAVRDTSGANLYTCPLQCADLLDRIMSLYIVSEEFGSDLAEDKIEGAAHFW